MVAASVIFLLPGPGLEPRKRIHQKVPEATQGLKCNDLFLRGQLLKPLPQTKSYGTSISQGQVYFQRNSVAASGPDGCLHQVTRCYLARSLKRPELLSAALAAQFHAARFHQPVSWRVGTERRSQGGQAIEGEGDTAGRSVQSAVDASISSDIGFGSDDGSGYNIIELNSVGTTDAHSLDQAKHGSSEESSKPANKVSHGIAAGTEEDKKESAGSNGGYRSYKAWQIDSEEGLPPPSAPDDQSSVSALWGSKASDSATFGVKEPVYQVLEVNAGGVVRKREVSRRQLLKSSGLRQRDVRRVDPSLWVTNSLPALLVRDDAILLNLGSLRAIATHTSVMIFDHLSLGAQTFLETLLARLRLDADASSSGAVTMPFEIEVVESALISRTQRLENALLDVEPKVTALLEQLPNKLTADALEELRLSKQALVELGAKAGSLRHMLLELLDHSADLRRMTAMSHRCTVFGKKDAQFVCETPGDKLQAEEEQEEVEMLLEYYLQRCDSCFGQAEKLLDSAKEMEDSISVNLSSRRLEVSRLELLLQVGTFAAALGALVAGIFGMNLRSRLEEHVGAFWLTSGGILLGGFILFLAMYFYLRRRRIL